MRPGNSQFNFRRYSYVNVSCEYTDRFRQSHHRVIEVLSFHFSFTKKDDEREGWGKKTGVNLSVFTLKILISLLFIIVIFLNRPLVSFGNI